MAALKLVELLLLMLVDALAADNVVTILVDSLSQNCSDSFLCWEDPAIPCETIELGLQGVRFWLEKDGNHTTALMIAGGATYYLNQSQYSQFKSVSNLKISGYQSELSNTSIATIKCGKNVGFSFIYCNNIHLSNVIFDGCGQLRKNTTSYNLNPSNPAYTPFVVTLYFLYCKNVSMNVVSVTNTHGVGTIIYNSVGTVSISSSSFINNHFQTDNELSGGGGLIIEFSYCDPGNISCLYNDEPNVNTSYTSNAYYMIDSTIFSSNGANTNVSRGNIILPLGKYHSGFGRGGGLSLYVIGNASNVKFEVTNCSFVNNTALWGGGLLVEFLDNAHDNYVFVNDSEFIDNSIHYNPKFEGTGGSGVRVNMLMSADLNSVIYNNSVTFTGCNFSNNINAYYGGGMSFYTSVNSVNKVNSPNHVQLYSCNFMYNIARLGAAIAISVYPPSNNSIEIYPLVYIHDVTVTYNKAYYDHSLTGNLVGVGAVYIDTIPVVFGGINTFHSNFGSALAMTACQIDVLKEMSFYNNTGRSGGAVVLYADAFIVTHPFSHMSFIENNAENFGGAIYSLSPGVGDQFGSRNCFLRFSNVSTLPYQWTSSFYFKSNKAKNQLNAIYASTVLPCVWIEGHNGINLSIVKQTFCWSDNWIYHNDSNLSESCTNQIMTAAADYKLPISYNVIPGDDILFNANVFDDMGNNVTDSTVFVVKVVDGPASFPGYSDIDNDYVNKYTYVSNERVELLGQPHSSVKLQVETIQPIIIEKEVKIQLQPCPPGFFISDQSSTAKCICHAIHMYGGFIRCNQNYTSSIIRSGWIGRVPGFNDTLLFGISPYFLEPSSSAQYTLLPQEINKLSEFLCNFTNANGVLCGSCKEGYGVVPEYVSSPCVYCPPGIEKYSWIFYILTSFLPVTILFGVIFMFSMTVTFGPLNSYIFFAQVISTTMTIDGEGQIPIQAITSSPSVLQGIYLVPYGIWNMYFFNTLLKYCLSPNLTTLGVLNLNFLQAIYPIILLSLFIVVMNLYGKGIRCVVCLCRPLHRCLARFRQWTNLRQSITGSIAAFIVIAYTKFILIALYIVKPASLFYPNGTVATIVFKFDGNIKYSIQNVNYMIPSILVLTVAVIPPVLFAYPTLINILWYLSCKKLPISKLTPSSKLQALLDEFHGCYKNGSKGGLDCRWFAGFYFCIRYVLLIVYSLSGSLLVQYTIQTVLFLIIVLLFLIFQPYQKPWINKLDIMMFLLLASISSLGMYNLTMTWIGQPLNKEVFVFQYILILIPLFYFIGYLGTVVCLKNKTKLLQLLRKSKIINENLVSVNSDQLAELTNSSHVPEFLDFIKDTGRLENLDNNRQNVILPAQGRLLSTDSLPLVSYDSM